MAGSRTGVCLCPSGKKNKQHYLKKAVRKSQLRGYPVRALAGTKKKTQLSLQAAPQILFVNNNNKEAMTLDIWHH